MSHGLVRAPDVQPEAFHGLVTVAPEMKVLFGRIGRAARSETTILLRGESGTGKELMARAIHERSPRAEAPFRGVNCATFSNELLSSELFGHMRGAFTGAVSDKPGLFSLTNGGTLFLDEVAEMPLGTQARLLRVLQERAFQPLGGTIEQNTDVRIISATNKSLRDLVEAGRFRDDLMYRIRVVVIYLPALRERSGDVEALAWYFITHFNQRGGRRIEAIRTDAWEALVSHDWPGNVRELRNNIEQAFALGDGPILELSDLTLELQGRPPPRLRSAELPARAPETFAELQRDEVLRALRTTRGRKTEAARLLGISRSTLWRRMRTLEID